ncbi:MAG: lipoyl(octanoyl) transferase LipB [Chloroflexota bacterium]|nr:lipoyl(octanoyl) transferase LipB [Chloroflexota bacterium]
MADAGFSNVRAVDSPAAVPTPRAITAVRLPGLVPYLPMWERQRVLAATRARGEVGDRLLLLEHGHVYTNGRRGDRRHLLVDGAELRSLGAAYHEVDRGGDVTYHGPGQMVGYPIVDLGGIGRGVRDYVRGLEEAIIRGVARFGVEAVAVPGYTGVWVGDEKLAAIGVRVARGVAYHGFALNVDPDLSYFGRIVPCGIPDRGVTSLARLLGRPVAVDDVVPLCAEAFAAVFGLDLRWAPPCHTESAREAEEAGA